MAEAPPPSPAALDLPVMGIARKFPFPIRWLLPAFISLATLLTCAYFSSKHPVGTYGTETDFYHLFAPDADRLAAGQFPENDFQGPGYPALIALVSRLTGDTFVAGKWVSIVSAALLVLLVYALFARLFGYWVGVGAALLFPVGPEILQFSISATTDIYFLLLCLAAFVVFVSRPLPAAWRMALAGIITSLAYLTRYNGLFLFVTLLFAILVLNACERAWKGRLLLATLFVAVFFATAAPWFYANYKHYGSPFYNANYLNMATAFYPELVNGNVFQDGTRPLREKFHSFGEVFFHDPWRIIKRYPLNLFENFVETFSARGVIKWLGALGVLGFFMALWRERKSKDVMTLLTALVMYFLLMGLNHWEARYYFFVGVGFTGLAVYALVGGLELLRERRPWLKRPIFGLLPAVLVVVAFAHGLVYAKENLTDFLNSHPLEVVAARDFILQREGAARRGLRIVARKPHLSYLSRQEWVFLPPVKSLDEFHEWLKKNPVDYIAIGTRELKERKSLKALGDPQTAPPWLETVYVSRKPLFILYKPKLTTDAQREDAKHEASARSDKSVAKPIASSTR